VAHKREVLAWLREQVKEAGAPDPDALADQLMIVLDGAQVLAASMGTEGPSRSMAPLVARLLPAGAPNTESVPEQAMQQVRP
jgi:hypothetical protein